MAHCRDLNILEMPFNDFSQPSSTHLLFDAYFFPEDELLHAETFLDILGEKNVCSSFGLVI
jgi:hypothetical protein